MNHLKVWHEIAERALFRNILPHWTSASLSVKWECRLAGLFEGQNKIESGSQEHNCCYLLLLKALEFIPNVKYFNYVRGLSMIRNRHKSRWSTQTTKTQRTRFSDILTCVEKTKGLAGKWANSSVWRWGRGKLHFVLGN
jgi:hypothetical protein